MQIDATTEWKNFRDSLLCELQLTPLQKFEEAWHGRKDKTGFYGSDLLHRVAERNHQSIWHEFLRCDFVLANTDGVPVVFIESENDHRSARDEIEKLCCVLAPVKVLFLSCEWHDSERAVYRNGWLERIKKQHSALPYSCIYMIVVGEWGRGNPCDEILRYYLESYDSDGRQVEDTILEITNK